MNQVSVDFILKIDIGGDSLKSGSVMERLIFVLVDVIA